MNATYILETKERPVEALKKFLAALWAETELQGMLVPTHRPGTMSLQSRLLRAPEELAELEPFAPFVPVSAARAVVKIAAENPDGRFGAVVRPCEARALFYNARLGFKNRELWLLVGIDCLASYPIQDLEWRAERIGSLERLSLESLRFARLGGIAPYRYRPACQMCLPTAPKHVDLNISIIGLPVNRLVLVEVRRKEVADHLRIARFTAGKAPEGLLTQREAALSRLESRHNSTRTRLIDALPAGLPGSPEDLVAYLRDCAPCRSCLEACPIYAGELGNHGNGKYQTSAETRRWLAECVLCGQCEQACPRQVALTAIHARLSQQLAEPLKRT